MVSLGRSSSPANGGLFDRVRMGYTVIASTKLAAWQHLLGDCFGMQVEASEQYRRFRLDERACRFLVQSGRSEDVSALGLELVGEDAHRTVMERLSVAGISVEMRDGEEAELRGVKRFWRIQGPKKLAVEFFHEPITARSEVKLGCSGFVTGDQGFGHIAFTTREPERTQAFWEKIFDLRYSDEVHQSISGVPLDFLFFRFNRRHHSIALASTPKIRLNPLRTQVQHIEVQANSLDDIGIAYRRCREMKFPISMSVGQHPNDKAVSFYVKSPSGFDFEYGWNPLPVEEAAWHPQIWNRISMWGHRPEELTLGERVAQLGRGLASLTRKEFVPDVEKLS